MKRDVPLPIAARSILRFDRTSRDPQSRIDKCDAVNPPPVYRVGRVASATYCSANGILL